MYIHIYVNTNSTITKHTHLYIYIYKYIYIYIHIYVICTYLSLSLCLFVYLSLSVCLSVFLSLCPLCLSVSVSVGLYRALSLSLSHAEINRRMRPNKKPHHRKSLVCLHLATSHSLAQQALTEPKEALRQSQLAPDGSRIAVDTAGLVPESELKGSPHKGFTTLQFRLSGICFSCCEKPSKEALLMTPRSAGPCLGLLHLFWDSVHSSLWPVMWVFYSISKTTVKRPG